MVFFAVSALFFSIKHFKLFSGRNNCWVMIRGKFLINYGRLAFRAVISAGIADHSVAYATDCQPSVSGQQRFAETNSKTSSISHKVHASCCGFPKDMVNGPSTVLEQGVFGDDACFIAKYKNTHIVGQSVIDNLICSVFFQTFYDSSSCFRRSRWRWRMEKIWN